MEKKDGFISVYKHADLLEKWADDCQADRSSIPRFYGSILLLLFAPYDDKTQMSLVYSPPVAGYGIFDVRICQLWTRFDDHSGTFARASSHQLASGHDL